MGIPSLSPSAVVDRGAWSMADCSSIAKNFVICFFPSVPGVFRNFISRLPIGRRSTFEADSLPCDQSKILPIEQDSRVYCHYGFQVEEEICPSLLLQRLLQRPSRHQSCLGGGRHRGSSILLLFPFPFGCRRNSRDVSRSFAVNLAAVRQLCNAPASTWRRFVW